MGVLIWHEYAHYPTMTTAIYAIWASYWGFFYRKFFWDFVNGTFRDPGGIQPAKQDAIFITLIVKFPIIQLFSMIVAILILMLEMPLPMLKGTSLHRSFVVRIVLLLMLAFLDSLFYQGINSAIYALISAFAWTRAQMKGEIPQEAKANRGTGGRA